MFTAYTIIKVFIVQYTTLCSSEHILQVGILPCSSTVLQYSVTSQTCTGAAGNVALQC